MPIKKYYFMFFLFVLMSICACASTQTVRDAKGSGESRIFSDSYEQVFDAAVEAMRDQAIEILEKDKATGTILGKKGMGVVTYGERVAVYIYKVDDDHTKVEVISKKVLATTIFAKDWTDSIFFAISQNLHDEKAK